MRGLDAGIGFDEVAVVPMHPDIVLIIAVWSIIGGKSVDKGVMLYCVLLFRCQLVSDCDCDMS